MFFTLPGIREKTDVPGQATNHRNAPAFLEVVNQKNMGQCIGCKARGGGRFHVSNPVAQLYLRARAVNGRCPAPLHGTVDSL
jgi:hypothetical protein